VALLLIIARGLSAILLILGSVITGGVPLTRHLGWDAVLTSVMLVLVILGSVLADLAGFHSGRVTSAWRWGAHVFAWMSAALLVAAAPSFTWAAVLIGVMFGVTWSVGITGVLPEGGAGVERGAGSRAWGLGQARVFTVFWARSQPAVRMSRTASTASAIINSTSARPDAGKSRST
jgi:hypothetical protein